MPATLIRSGVHHQMRVQNYYIFSNYQTFLRKSSNFAPKLIKEKECRILGT